ncbi:TPA: fimbrial protein [Providencia alcalifaciens]
MKMKLLTLGLATLTLGSTAFAATVDVGNVVVSTTLVQPTCTAKLDTNTIDFGNMDVNLFKVDHIGAVQAEKGLALTLEHCPSTVNLKVQNSEGTVAQHIGGAANHHVSGLVRDSTGNKINSMQIRLRSNTTGSGNGYSGGWIKLNGEPVTYDLSQGGGVSHTVVLGSFAKAPLPALGVANTTLQYTLEYN